MVRVIDFQNEKQILSNVGVDMMGMLMESCDLFVSGRTRLWSLIQDSLLFLIIVWTHSFVVMSIGMVWYVSMESEKAILAFMIVSNFGEIKTTVFKRFDNEKLFTLCRMDIVERVNLLIAAGFILVEDLGQIRQWTFNGDLWMKCGWMLLLESIVDVSKHSVVMNFNGVRPDVYREYLKDIFQTLLQRNGEGTVKKLVFEPVGSCILFLRVLISSLSVGNVGWFFRMVVIVSVFFGLFVVKILLGLFLEAIANWYLRYFESNYGSLNLFKTKQISPTTSSA